MTKVAVIGCGPSGIFFLHAVALRRKRLEEEGKHTSEEIAALLPEVTVFERSPSPGGIWRSDRNKNKKDGEEESTAAATASMYEALWTNGPKECIEFFDYTFDEHFGCALPMYMPRQLILDYILARCTKDNSNFFDDVKFNTSVKSVTFNDDLGKFIVQTMDHNETATDESSSVTESIFDKCLWAAGNNGTPKIPQSISNALSSGGFKGRVMHSSETGSDFDKCVRGKKILIIGDSYSAEDLTLEAIKLGVDTVDICSRSGSGIAYYTGSWPMDKVDVWYAYMPTGVTEDGRVVLTYMPTTGVTKEDGDGVVLTTTGTKEEMTLDDIETVIYCTGYKKNMDMLDPSLRPNMSGPYFAEYDIPKDWKMPKNALSKEFGDIPIGRVIEPPFVMHDMYRGQLISNPNMMFFLERLDTPLVDLDVTAWLFLAQITGDLPLPEVAEMKEFNLNTFLDAMADPICRGYDDQNYKNRWWEVDDKHWTYSSSDKRVKQMNRTYLNLQFRILARDMVDAKYPLQLGTYKKLNEKGKAFVEFNEACGHARYDLDEGSPDASWRTFRDCNPSKCYSVMTGTKAAPLKCHWLDLDGHSKEEIVDTTAPKQKARGITGKLRDKLRIH